jgi:cobalt-zinc-cadmium efflux system protein
MPHDHHHDHAHTARGGHGRAFAWGITLNLGFVLVEASFGVLANSMALLADAGHNLSDVLGLVVAWVAVVLARRPPSARFTYGLRAGSILAALFNALFLLVAIGWMAWEAVGRLSSPEPVAEGTVMVVAGIGILVNGFTAWLFSGGRGDLNIRGAYLHMAADAGVSAAVVLGALAMWLTGWLWLDPVVSLAVGAVIIWSGWGLLRDSLGLALGAVPAGIDAEEVSRFLCAHPGVESLHDLHIWAVSTTETALTAHLVMPAGHPGDAFLMALARSLEQRFAIGHVTLQVEIDRDTACTQAPGHVV